MKTNPSIYYIFDQMRHLMTSLNNDQYSTSLPILGGSSIGQHIRHIYDFYNCIRLSSAPDYLDYSCRDRNPDIETNLDFALNLFESLGHDLSNLDITQTIYVATDFSIDDDDERTLAASSIGRELMYAFDHAVHHLAIIKMGINASFQNVVLPPEMGVAPSTLKYKKVNIKS